MTRLGMIGGNISVGMLAFEVKSNGYWQSLDGRGTAHSEDYVDYSQLYREYTHERKHGYVAVGDRNGKPVYAAPDYLRSNGVYVMVSAASYKKTAERLGALLPTRDEVKSLLKQAIRIKMPTQPIYRTGGPGSAEAYTAAIDKILNGKDVNAPISHGKEFYVVE